MPTPRKIGVSLVTVDVCFKWTCPKCGLIHLEPPELLPTSMVDPIAVRRYRKDNGLPQGAPIPDGTFTRHPIEVICHNCEIVFDSHAGELDDARFNIIQD